MRARILVPGLLALVCGLPAAAQIPDEFSNLQLISKEIGKRELVATMREYSRALGVNCSHCHIGSGEGTFEGYDFASDDLEPKRVARAMMKMTSEINGKLMRATGRRSLTRVECSTCHRGVLDPRGLDDILMSTLDSQGVDAASARYRELRRDYHGAGVYDFSSRTLDDIAETLAQEKSDLDGAIVIMKLNLEFHPDSAQSHLMLGQFHMAAGTRDAAIASVERAIALEPENQYAKSILERLRASK